MKHDIPVLLQRIQLLLSQHPSAKLSAMERDLLLQYIRSLYEEIYFCNSSPVNEQSPVDILTTLQKESLQPEALLLKKQPEVQMPAVTDVKQLVTEQIAAFEIRQEQTTEGTTDIPPVAEVPDFEGKPKAQVVKSINERIAPPSTLNEKIKPASEEIHKKFASRPLKELIDLNKRFVFINELFRGDSASYTEVIQHIDSLTGYSEAEAYIQRQLIQPMQWDMATQSARLFMKLVKQRFGQE